MLFVHLNEQRAPLVLDISFVYYEFHSFGFCFLRPNLCRTHAVCGLLVGHRAMHFSSSMSEGMLWMQYVHWMVSMLKDLIVSNYWHIVCVEAQ